MRLSVWTATSTSVARRRSVRERSPSPITRLNLPMVASARHRCDDPAGVGVHAEMELLPGPARAAAVLLGQPLAGPAELQARAVHQQVHGFGSGPAAARPWPRHLQRLGPAT